MNGLNVDDMVFVKTLREDEDIFKGLITKIDNRFLYLSVSDGLLIINIDRIDTIFRPSPEAILELTKEQNTNE